jgi:protein involved in polysaccharide export with SLBB domain
MRNRWMLVAFVVALGFTATLGLPTARCAEFPKYVIEPPDLLTIEVSKLGKKQQPIEGVYLIRQDGTILLGLYGSVSVAGLTLEQARDAIITHLKLKKKTKVRVDVKVAAYNSKFYFVTTAADKATNTNKDALVAQVYRFACTGNECVHDAIAQIQGLGFATNQSVWIAREQPGSKTEKILRVNWEAITKMGDEETNYQIFPNDRIYIGSSPPK